MDERFIATLDGALPKLGYKDRASYIRDALKEKLEADGYSVTLDLVTPPSRAGKGGFRAGAKQGAPAPVPASPLPTSEPAPVPVPPSVVVPASGPVNSTPGGGADGPRRPTREEVRASSQACIAAVRAAAEAQAREMGRPELAPFFSSARLREMAEAARTGQPLPRPTDPPRTIPPPARPTDKPGQRSKKTPLPS